MHATLWLAVSLAAVPTLATAQVNASPGNYASSPSVGDSRAPAASAGSGGSGFLDTTPAGAFDKNRKFDPAGTTDPVNSSDPSTKSPPVAAK